MDFQQAMRQYRILRRAYQSGQIPADSFEKRINSMVVHDADGQKWMIGVSSGHWYRHDGQNWLRDNPPIPPTLQPAPVVELKETQIEQKQEDVSEKKKNGKKQKGRKRWLIGLLFAFLILACAALVITGLMTNLIKVPEQILALGRSPTTTLTNTTTPDPTLTPTATLPPPTPTATLPPFDLGKTILGNWSANNTKGTYHFYPDSSFVFYDLENNQYAGGQYSIAEENSLNLETILGEEIVTTTALSLFFENENAMIMTTEDGVSDSWSREKMVSWTSQYDDPIAVLFELSYRLGWGFPDPDCGFDTTDEETEFRYICLDFEDGTSITWVDQAASTGTDRKMERNLVTINIDHQSEESYQGEIDYITANLKAADPFHGFETYSTTSDLGWFSIDDFSWFDGPWIYSVFRINAYQSPNPPPGLTLTLETLYEILEGKPPHSNPATTPTEGPDGSYQYSEQILGTWKQRHASEEILEFKADNTIQVSSEPGDYDYSGVYYFTDDVNVVFELDVGIVNAEITIDENVLTLTINGIASTYDRLE